MKFQHVDVEIGRFGAVLRDVDARERKLFRREARDVFLLAPADESQIVYGQRRLQVGQDVVRGAQIDGEAVACGRRGFEVDVVQLVNLLAGVVALGRDVETGGGDVESACGVDPPLLFSVRHVESGEVHAGAGGSDEEFAADTDVKPVVEQRKRVAEGRFEVAVGREPDVVDVAARAFLEECEERVGQRSVGGCAGVEVERPEILVVAREGAEADEVHAGVDAQQVVGLESRKRLSGRNGFVEQRDQFPVAGIEQFVHGQIAAGVDVYAAQTGNVDIAAQRCESRVELAAEGRSLHEVSRRVLGGNA